MLYLVKCNVPWDVAMELDDLTRDAWCVIFQELDGAEFDVDRMAFVERKS